MRIKRMYCPRCHEDVVAAKSIGHAARCSQCGTKTVGWMAKAIDQSEQKKRAGR